MTAASPLVLRTIAFGEQQPGVWGAVWSIEAASFVVLADGFDVIVAAAALAGDEPTSDWTLRGDGFELTLAGELEMYLAESNGSQRFDQVCRVVGRFRLDAEEHEVSCLGYRGVQVLDSDLDRLDSLRGLATVFETGEALGLIAARPRRAKGHGADAVSAAVLEPDGAVVVEDPRLSTTYSHDGRPSRAALELWIGDQQGEHQLRRAAGEALGPRAIGSLGDLVASADLFRWHSRGADGIGVYLLARRG